MKEFIITKNEAGQRLDKYLARCLPAAGGAFIHKMLRKKNFVLNGKRAEGNERLKESDAVRLYLSDETYLKFSSVPKSSIAPKDVLIPEQLKTVYEDEDILVFSKPAGMLSQKAKETDRSVVEYLIAYLLNEGAVSKESLKTFRPSVCNRLDRNTSGLILCSKRLSGSQYLSRILKDHSLKKYYQTVVVGTVQKHLLLEGSLVKDKKANKVTLCEGAIDGGSAVKTEIFPLKRFSFQGQDYTELSVLIHTGKSHQIRAHLSSIGHPLVGDGKYNNGVFDPLAKAMHLTCHLLHASKVVFPEDDRYHGMELTDDLPKIFERIRKKAGYSL